VRQNRAGKRTYAMAGAGPKDIDVTELYDCFTPVVIIELQMDLAKSRADNFRLIPANSAVKDVLRVHA
jgi:hypothetical protein